MPMVRGSGAHATDRPVLAPLFFEVWPAEQPAAHAALPSVHREERSSTRGACERQAHHSIVAQSGQGCVTGTLGEAAHCQTTDGPASHRQVRFRRMTRLRSSVAGEHAPPVGEMVKRDQAFQETLLAGMKSGPLRPPRCTVDRQRFASGGSTVRRSV